MKIVKKIVKTVKKKYSLVVDITNKYLIICRTEGGSRTHTGFEAHWILSPARLPVPPLLQIQLRITIYELRI